MAGILSDGGRPLRGRRVFVTGANGTVGAVLCETLLARGASVVASLRPESQTDEMEGLGVSITHAPIFDTTRLAAAMLHCDTVVHCAAITGRRRTSPSEMWRVNADGPAAVWQAASGTSVRRFIHVSTTGVYGCLRNWPADESTPPRPDTFYRRSKWAGEVKLQALASNQKGPGWLFARPTSVIGPGLGGWRSVADSLRRGRAWVIGDGSQPTHLSHVDDIAGGLADAVAADDVEGTVVNLGAAAWHPLRTFLAIMAEQIGMDADRAVRRLPVWPLRPWVAWTQRTWGRVGPEPVILHALAFISQPRAYCIDRARRLLDFAPRVDLHEAVVRAFGEHGGGAVESAGTTAKASRGTAT